MRKIIILIVFILSFILFSYFNKCVYLWYIPVCLLIGWLSTGFYNSYIWITKPNATLTESQAVTVFFFLVTVLGGSFIGLLMLLDKIDWNKPLFCL